MKSLFHLNECPCPTVFIRMRFCFRNVKIIIFLGKYLIYWRDCKLVSFNWSLTWGGCGDMVERRDVFQYQPAHEYH